jgi:diguanylate cyclase (GGDEF)-like protein
MFALPELTCAICLAFVVGAASLVLATTATAHSLRGVEREYERLATIDGVTGLANRISLERHLHDRLCCTATAGNGLGVMFIDVDDFKNINDSLGHEAGDQVLRAISGRMRNALRPSDVVARYGGDEFVALISDVDEPRNLAQVARQLLESVTPAISVLERELFVTLSVGIAHSPADGTDVATLLKHADSAMYRAKEKGRNGFQFFATEMDAAAVERLEIGCSLWRALRERQFIVHYQPKRRVSDGRVSGFEALLRWDHPRLGILPPARFVPRAEHSGAIEPIGEWVLGAALGQLRNWHESEMFEGTVAVNISMRQLYNTDFPGIVRRALERERMDPAQLELEVTESMVSLNPEVAIRILRELSHLGVCISLDDFGTGQSSLEYVLRFPITKLKIDRAFTAGVGQSERASAIVRTIIVLARNLGFRVVAEGIETVEQRRFFENEGCDELQGFLLGLPMKADEATSLLSREGVGVAGD